MKTRIITTSVVFLFVQLVGFFIAWIGGVEPFTPAAGALAIASVAAGLVAALNTSELF